MAPKIQLIAVAQSGRYPRRVRSCHFPRTKKFLYRFTSGEMSDSGQSRSLDLPLLRLIVLPLHHQVTWYCLKYCLKYCTQCVMCIPTTTRSGWKPDPDLTISSIYLYFPLRFATPLCLLGIICLV